MSRLASQAKAGFYPTPDSVCELLNSKLSFEEGSRGLDPCCGEGEALAQLIKPGAASYGVELDHSRAQRARTQLDHVLWGDSLSEITVSSHSFGLLYLNPPYDLATDGDGKSRRLEVEFLRRYLGTLQQGGILILVIPYYVLKQCAKPLARYFEFKVYCFPEEEFDAFKQCVVVGTKISLAPQEEAEQRQAQLEYLADLDPDLFQIAATALRLAPIISIPSSDKPLMTFKAKRIDPLIAVPLMQKADILRGALEELTPRKKNEIRPLTPLENGHLALMLAGGYMNGAVKKDGRQLVIKGVIHKSEKVIRVTETESGGTITTKDQYQPTVKVIDMHTARLLTVQ